MNIVCLDMEGVLVPEIWIAFAEASGIPELKRTTRDEPDYDKLMKWRLEILKEHGLGLKEIQETIAKIDPMPGAKEFLDELRSLTQVIILSDTFEQFATPLMKKLGWPTIFCNTLDKPLHLLFRPHKTTLIRWQFQVLLQQKFYPILQRILSVIYLLIHIDRSYQNKEISTFTSSFSPSSPITMNSPALGIINRAYCILKV